jgi:hypothetical protein
VYEYDFAGAHNRSWNVLEAELVATVLLCIRCHTGVEDGFRDLPSEIKADAMAAAGRRLRRRHRSL